MLQNNHMYLPAKWQQMSSGVVEFMAKCPLRGHPRATQKFCSTQEIDLSWPSPYDDVSEIGRGPDCYNQMVI